MKPRLTLPTAALLLCARTLPAQTAGVTVPIFDSATERCLASIPDSAMRRLPVFAVVRMRDTSDHAVPPSAENLLQVIADRIQVMLGAKPEVLAHGEPRVDWRELVPGLRVSWYRDGQLRWAVDGDSIGVTRPHAAGARLLAAALDSARTAGDVFMPWPDSARTDSIRFSIELVRPTIDSAGVMHPSRAKPEVPVFSVVAPRTTDVVPIRDGHFPEYPSRAQAAAASGAVVASFEVDTSGRVDLRTFHDVWPSDTPRPQGWRADYYADFVNSVRATLPKYRFVPARYGGCRVRETVTQMFTFSIGQ